MCAFQGISNVGEQFNCLRMLIIWRRLPPLSCCILHTAPLPCTLHFFVLPPALLASPSSVMHRLLLRRYQRSKFLRANLGWATSLGPFLGGGTISYGSVFLVFVGPFTWCFLFLVANARLYASTDTVTGPHQQREQTVGHMQMYLM